MSNRVTSAREALIAWLEDHLGDLVQIITIDPAAAKPSPGRVAIFIEPPELDYSASWTAAPEIGWKLDIIAGTPATQPTSLDLITDAIETLADNDLNIASARPVSFTLPNGAGTLAAYEVTLNPLD